MLAAPATSPIRCVLRLCILSLAVTWMCSAVACGADDAAPASPIAPYDGSPEYDAPTPDGGADDAQTDSAWPEAALQDGTADASWWNGGAPTLVRVGNTFEVPTITESTPKRYVDVAHDPAHDLYLVVHGNAVIGGAFVSAEGVPVGQPFAVSSSSGWCQAPRVVWGNAVQRFLVTWHDGRDDPSHARVYGRMVTWSGAGPDLSQPDFPISEASTYQEAPAAAVWSETSQEALVVFQDLAGGGDIHARRIDLNGNLLGHEVVLTSDPDWQGEPAVAWNPARDEYLVAYTHAAGSEAAIYVQRLPAGIDTPGAPLLLTTAAGTWTPSITHFVPLDRYLVVWWESKAVGQFVRGDGVLDGEPIQLIPGFGSYDGLALAQQPASGLVALVSHGNTAEDFAAGVTPSGEQGPITEATSSPAGTTGNFNPRAAGHTTRREWLLVSVRSFQTIVAQRLAVP